MARYLIRPAGAFRSWDQTDALDLAREWARDYSRRDRDGAAYDVLDGAADRPIARYRLGVESPAEAPLRAVSIDAENVIPLDAVRRLRDDTTARKAA